MKLPPNHVPGVGVQAPSALGGIGERLLKNMGWVKGEGLGRNGQGVRTAIEAKVKDDKKGIGKADCENWEIKWWEDAYRTAAERIQVVEEDGSASDGSSDEEVVLPQEGVRNADGTATTATPQELRILASLNKQTSWMAAGRFSGRAGKLARLQAQEAQTTSTKLQQGACAYDANQAASASQLATPSAAPCNKDPLSSAMRGRCHFPATSAAGNCQRSCLEQADAQGSERRWEDGLHVAGDTQGAGPGLAGRGEGTAGLAPFAKPSRQELEKRGSAETRKEELGRGDPAVSLRSAQAVALPDDGPNEKLRRKGTKRCMRKMQLLGSEGGGEAMRKMKKRKKKGAGGVGEGEEVGGGTGLTAKPCQEGGAAGQMQHGESSFPMAAGRLDLAQTSSSPRGIAGAQTCMEPPQWWGSSKFVSGGLLEGLDRATASALNQERRMFDESTQEALYNSVQGNKSANKQGLGTRDLPRKVGGVRWQGRRHVFPDGTVSESSAMNAEPGRADGTAPAGNAKSLPCLSAAQLGGPHVGSVKIRWKRLATQALRQADASGMRMSKLLRALLAAAPPQQAIALSALTKKELRSSLRAQVAGSSKFEVNGKRVMLSHRTL